MPYRNHVLRMKTLKEDAYMPGLMHEFIDAAIMT